MDRTKQIYLIFCSSWTKSHFRCCSFFLTAQKLHCRLRYQVYAELLPEELSWEWKPRHQKNLLLPVFKGNQNKSKDSWLWARKYIGPAVAVPPHITQSIQQLQCLWSFAKLQGMKKEMRWINWSLSDDWTAQKSYTIRRHTHFFIDNLPTIWKCCWW